jgi:hypothetical protein
LLFRQHTLDAKQRTMDHARNTLVKGQLELERRVNEWVANKIADAENAQAKAQRDLDALKKTRQGQEALLETKQGDKRKKDAEIAEKQKALAMMGKTQEQKIVEIELTKDDVGSKSVFVNGVCDGYQYGKGYMPQSGGQRGDAGFYVPLNPTFADLTFRFPDSQPVKKDTCTVLYVDQPFATPGIDGKGRLKLGEGWSQLAANKGLVTGDVIVGFAIGKTTNWGRDNRQRFEDGQFVPGNDSKQEEFLQALMKAEGYQPTGPNDGKKWEKLEPLVKDGVEHVEEGESTVKQIATDSTEYLFFPMSEAVAATDQAYDYKKSGTDQAPQNLAAMSQVGGLVLAEKLLTMNEHLFDNQSTRMLVTGDALHGSDRAVWTKVLGCMRPPLIIRVVRHEESQVTQDLRADIVELEAAKASIQTEIEKIEYDHGPAKYSHYDEFRNKTVLSNYPDGRSTPHNNTAKKEEAQNELESATENNSDQIMGPYKDLSKLLDQQAGGRDSRLHAFLSPGDDSKLPEATRSANLKSAKEREFGTAAFAPHWTPNIEKDFLDSEDTQVDNQFGGGASNFEWKYIGFATKSTKVFKSSTQVLGIPGILFSNAAKEWRQQEAVLNAAKITDKDLKAGIDSLDAKVPFLATAMQFGGAMQFREQGRRKSITELDSELESLRRKLTAKTKTASKVAVSSAGGEATESLDESIKSKEEKLASERTQLREDRRTYLDSIEKPGSFAILSPATTLGQFMAQKEAITKMYSKPKMDQILRNIASKGATLAKDRKELKDLKDIIRQLDNQIGDLDVEQAAHQKVFQQAKSDLKKADTERQKHIDTVSNISTQEEVQKLRVEGIEHELSSVAQEISDVKDDLKVFQTVQIDIIFMLLFPLTEQADVGQEMCVYLQVHRHHHGYLLHGDDAHTRKR